MDDSNVMAVKYLGRVSVVLAVGFALCFLASLGYNTYITYTGKKIEVRTENSNSTYLNTVE